jgi:hypothetical protein
MAQVLGFHWKKNLGRMDNDFDFSTVGALVSVKNYLGFCQKTKVELNLRWQLCFRFKRFSYGVFVKINTFKQVAQSGHPDTKVRKSEGFEEQIKKSKNRARLICSAPKHCRHPNKTVPSHP